MNVTTTALSVEERNYWARLEQKTVGWLQKHIEKFSEPFQTVPDPFSRTSATAKECMELSLSRHFVDFEVDRESFTSSIEVRADTARHKLLNKNSAF